MKAIASADARRHSRAMICEPGNLLKRLVKSFRRKQIPFGRDKRVWEMSAFFLRKRAFFFLCTRGKKSAEPTEVLALL